MHRGHFVQVEVIGDNFRADAPRQLDQFVIHVPGLRNVFLQNPHIHLWHLLNLLQYLEPAPSALTLQRIRRIGDHLQLVQHELRHSENTFEELRIAYIGDAAVDQTLVSRSFTDSAGAEFLPKNPSKALTCNSPPQPEPRTSPR